MMSSSIHVLPLVVLAVFSLCRYIGQCLRKFLYGLLPARWVMQLLLFNRSLFREETFAPLEPFPELAVDVPPDSDAAETVAAPLPALPPLASSM